MIPKLEQLAEKPRRLISWVMGLATVVSALAATVYSVADFPVYKILAVVLSALAALVSIGSSVLPIFWLGTRVRMGLLVGALAASLALALTTFALFQTELTPMSRVVGNVPANLRECVAANAAAGEPYVIKSMTMTVSLWPDDSAMKRARVRINYEIFALREIRRTDDVFTEQYSSETGTVERVPGSQSEVEIERGPHSIRYRVPFEARPGQNVVVSTGAKYSYPMPRQSQKVLGGAVLVNSQDEFWAYPSSDKICEAGIRIQIEGGRFNVQQQRQLAFRQRSSGDIEGTEARNSEGVIEFTWRDLLPGETVAILAKPRDP